MGYAVSVEFKSKAECDSMREFLLKEQDTLKKILALDRAHLKVFSTEPTDGKNLGYAPKKPNLLGFAGRTIPETIWDLCAWMSVQSGVKNTKGQHYLYYDNKKMPVVFDTENTQNTVVSADGVPIETPLTGSLAENLGTLALRKLGLELDKGKEAKLFEELTKNWYTFCHEQFVAAKANTAPTKGNAKTTKKTPVKKPKV